MKTDPDLADRLRAARLDDELVVLGVRRHEQHARAERVAAGAHGRGVAVRGRARARRVHGVLHGGVCARGGGEPAERGPEPPRVLARVGAGARGAGEDHQKAIHRCFRELLNLRNKRYESIADLRLDYSFHHNPRTTVKNLLDLIEAV